MSTPRPIEITELSLHSIYLTGAQVRSAMAVMEIDPLQFNTMPSSRVTGMTVLGAEINNDPTAASPIFVQMQVAPSVRQAQQDNAFNEAEIQQRRRLLSSLRRYARFEPGLARDTQFWSAMASAEKGQHLSQVQRQVLRGAWMTRSRLFTPPVWRHSSLAHRTFMRSMTTATAFKHNNYFTTAMPQQFVTQGRRVVLGEEFEGAVFDKFWPQSKVVAATVESTVAPTYKFGAKKHAKQPKQRVMEIEGGAVSAAEFAARPAFIPKLTPNFSDTDSGDD